MRRPFFPSTLAIVLGAVIMSAGISVASSTTIDPIIVSLFNDVVSKNLKIPALGVADTNPGPVTYSIRKDSYIDKSMGVAHVFVNQLVYGLKVLGSDVNFHLFDGRILSQDGSLYHGRLPSTSPFPSANSDPTSDDQDPLGSTATTLSAFEDFRPALLSFVSRMTPDGQLNVDETSRDGIVVRPAQQSSRDVQSASQLRVPEFIADQVPGTIGSVKAGLAYAQRGGGLELVWQFEVPMQNHHWDASVAATPPYGTVSVHDWTIVDGAPGAQGGGGGTFV